MHKNKKYKKTVLLNTLFLLGLTACTRSADPTTEAVLEDETIIVIETEDQAEADPMPRLGIDGAVLPTLDEVTTAADNAVLAPAYLRKGDQHQVVKQLQERLMSLGFMDNDEPTTYYGDATAEAIRHFQRQNDMQQDGICGIDTWDKLFSASAPYYKVSKGDDGEDIARIQQRLYELGYLTDNSTTGHFGDSTEAAVRKMQEVNGIGVDGAVGYETINLLYSDEVKANLIVFGEKSELVLSAQKRLKALGYLREEPDGNFGAATQRAIKEFQSRNDQVVDGYLGPSTRAVLNSDTAKPFGLRVGDSSESVRLAQQRLKHYGYLSSGSVTGYYGSVTEAAVKLFQKYNNLTQDGTVGIQTMSKLESSNAKRKPANVSTPRPNQGSSSQSSGSQSSGQGAGQSSGGSVGSGGETVSGSAAHLISIASSKLGCPYVWGAKGPNAFDCSGFVYWCLNNAGVRQSYLTSSGWRNPGRYQRISNFNDIRAGDVVVVRGHVGIAAGNGTVIDASSSNGRVVHRALSDWWRRNFIVAWRIFG